MSDEQNTDKTQKDGIGQTENTEKKKGSGIRRWIVAGAVAVCIICLAVIGIYYYHRYVTEKKYEELRDAKNSVTFTPTPKATLTPTPALAPVSATPSASPSPTLTPTPTEAVILPEYYALYERNNDFAAWIRIEDTVIDYPVMHIPGETAANGKDFYYLYRDFDGNPNTGDHKPGSLFIDGRCSVFPDRSDNLIVYGHNMNAGTMFAALHKFRDKSFYDSHRTFTFDTLYSRDTYEIVSVFIMQIGEQYSNNFKFYSYVDFKNEATFDYFFDNITALELYDTGVEPEYGDELVTLVTCTERAIANGRLVVVARKIEGRE